MVSFMTFPNGLILKIAYHLERDDLLNFRLTCKSFACPGARALFEQFRLYISDATPSPQVSALQQHLALMGCIKDLDLWLFHDSFEQVAEDFVARLPALRSLTFDMPYGAHPSVILQSLFAKVHTNDSPLRRLRLRIRYGNHSPPHGFIEDEATAAVLQGVSELQLHLDSYLDRGIGNGYRTSRNESFYLDVVPHPCSLWLSPDFLNIRRLVLTFGTGWIADQGFAPKLDFRLTYFRHLEHLALSNFLICHDWVLDWLGKHGPTMTTLDLAFTSILRHRHVRYVLDEEGYPRYDVASQELHQSTFTRTWKDIFELVIEHFFKLRSFNLSWFTEMPSESSAGNPTGSFDDLELAQGLYASCYPDRVGFRYNAVPQSRGTKTTEDALLLYDEVSLCRLIDKIGKDNCTIKAVWEVYKYLPDPDTDSESDYCQGIEELDDWVMDDRGNIFTSASLPQLEPRD